MLSRSPMVREVFFWICSRGTLGWSPIKLNQNLFTASWLRLLKRHKKGSLWKSMNAINWRISDQLDLESRRKIRRLTGGLSLTQSKCTPKMRKTKLDLALWQKVTTMTRRYQTASSFQKSTRGCLQLTSAKVSLKCKRTLMRAHQKTILNKKWATSLLQLATSHLNFKTTKLSLRLKKSPPTLWS